MPSTLIKPDQDFAIWAVLLSLAAFGFWSERRTWGRRFSGVMMVIVGGIVLSNLRIIPTAAPVYNTVWKYLVPAAIPLLLFQANLRRIFRESGPTLVAFIIGSIAVMAGTFVALTFVSLGPSTPELAGIFSATYIGGSLNFAAVAQAVGFQQGDLLTAALAADNVATSFHFLLIIALPGFVAIARFFPTHHIENAVVGDSHSDANRHRIGNLDVAGLVGALAVSFTLCAIGFYVAALFGAPQFAILIITALALLMGTFLPGPLTRLSGDYEAGNVLMFIFFAAVGASADIWVLIDMAPILFLFAVIIIAVHLVLLFGIGKFLKFDLAELIVASAACIGGPGSAAALASAKGWRELVTPAVLSGSLGYAGGTFIGVALVEWLK
ncbi:MAG: DUF819 domain-containing protein [Sphingomonadales bacterium]